ncbi:MAG TPA: FHA domain-containing protein [Polyangia bacterium]|nr:FHA domain-containing protein [Polyangia bacterium]
MELYVLRVQYPDGRFEKREFQPGRYRIGREAGDIVLGDPQVSSVHAEVIFADGRANFTDLGSTNGSMLGGQRLSGTVALPEQELVQLGSSSIVLLQVIRKGGTQVMGAAGAATVALPRPPAAARPVPVPPVAVAAVPAPRPPVAVAAPPAPRPMAAAPLAPRPVAAAPLAPRPVAAVAPAPVEDAPQSAPAGAVRHSYPLAIEDAGLGTAFGLLMKTLPFLLVRLGILVAFTFLGVAVWAVALLGFWLFRKVPIVGLVWFVMVLGAAGWFWRAILRYTLYMLKAAHIAVLTELLTKGEVGNGQQSMFSYAKEVVKERFGEINVLFALDLLVDGVVGAFNRTLDWVSSLLPVPGLDSVAGVVKAVLRASTTYIDETVLSYNLARGDENVFRSSKDGLIYYAQNAKEVLKTGVYVVVLEKVLTVLIWVVMLAPAFAMSYFVPRTGPFAFFTVFIISFLLAGNVRSAFLKPLFLTMVMIKFHTQIRDQPINETWDARLESASDKFRELKDKALAWGK